MKTCQFLCHVMLSNNGHLASNLGGLLFQKHPNPQMLPYTQKTWQHSHDWNWKLKICLFLGLFYIMVRDYDHGNVESLQNTSKNHPMQVFKSFMCALIISKCNVKCEETKC
jgi:hypothetical protein